jgi:hypothetical protein
MPPFYGVEMNNEYRGGIPHPFQDDQNSELNRDIELAGE